MDYKYGDITEKIIKAAMTVHSTLSNGFQEVIYQRALAIEMELMGLKFEREMSMRVLYKNVPVGERRVDFFVEQKISVELKAVARLDNTNLAQGKNYLEAYNLEVGLLINFGSNSLDWKRLFNNKYKPDTALMPEPLAK
jgi:GxxExxY protein